MAVLSQRPFPRPISIQALTSMGNVHIILLGPNDEAAFFKCLDLLKLRPRLGLMAFRW